MRRFFIGHNFIIPQNLKGNTQFFIPMGERKIFLINIAALSQSLLEEGLKKAIIPNIAKVLSKGFYRAMNPLFPGLTCSVQATLLSGKPPRDHGIVGNGFFDKSELKPKFWAQEESLVAGPRIWDWMREKGKTTAVIFWQNSKYINAEFVLSPSPIHTEEGMIEWVYSKPKRLYDDLRAKIGDFKLMYYWGPMAGLSSSKWIINSAMEIFRQYKPDLNLIYIPHLDYISQKASPRSSEVLNELKEVDSLIGQILSLGDHDIIILSEYGIVDVSNTIYPNLILRDEGFIEVRNINGKEYLDYELSKAFVLVDHQIAHLYLGYQTMKNFKPSEKNKLIQAIKSLFKKQNIRALAMEEQKDLYINHYRSGDLVLLAPKDSWFSYNFWLDQKKRPYFADYVDIHNKPGYDPNELFFVDSKIPSEKDINLIKGSHGLPAESPWQMAVFITNIKNLESYAPKEFNTTHLLSMLYRIT